MDDKKILVRSESNGDQAVGIHTDITFEVDDKKKNQSKKSDGRTVDGEDPDSDDEVPIYRGMHTDQERDRDFYNRNNDRRYNPNMNPNRPRYPGVNDEQDTVTFIRFLPSSNGQWTTERYSESFIPQSMLIDTNGLWIIRVKFVFELVWLF